MMKKDKSEYVINVVAKALDLLELYNSDGEEFSAIEISNLLKIPKPSTQKLLMTLDSRDYLEFDKLTGRYRLGLHTLELGQVYLHQGGLQRRSGHVLQNVAEECQETTYLSQLEEQHVVYTNVVESNLTVRVVSRLGMRLPAHCTAAGKVHLAFLPQPALEKIYAQFSLDEHTPRTHTSLDSLNKELQQISQQGFAIDDEELDRGVRCVAAPIRDHTQNIVGALSISGPSFRISHERILKELAPMLKNASNQLSVALGFMDGQRGE